MDIYWRIHFSHMLSIINSKQKENISCSFQDSTLTFLATFHVGQVTLQFCLSGRRITCLRTGQVDLSRYTPSYRFYRTFLAASSWNNPGNSNLHLVIKFCFFFTLYSFCNTERHFTVFFSGIMKLNFDYNIFNYFCDLSDY